MLSQKHNYGTALVHNCGIIHESPMRRRLNEFNEYARLNSGLSVIRKVVRSGEFINLGDTLLYDAFRLSTYVRGQSITDGHAKTSVYTSGGKGYIAYDASGGPDCFDSYKLVLSRVTNEHGFKSVNGKYTVFGAPVILQPFEVCSNSYLVFSGFHSKHKVLNLAKYINTKFVRFIALNATSSVNVNPTSFALVPVQDFSDNSYIDWSVSLESIDRQLYAKYGLSKEDIASIENRILPYREVTLKNSNNNSCLYFDTQNGWVYNQ